MSASPKKAPSMKEKLAAISAKRDGEMAAKRDIDISTSSDIETLAPASEQPQVPARKTLPKVTLYAHDRVLKSIRLLAVEDGVQAQDILRRAVKDYLATRGHHYKDLTTGE